MNEQKDTRTPVSAIEQLKAEARSLGIEFVDDDFEIGTTEWRNRRRRVNDEQALDDMLGRGTPPADVPRGTHQEDDGRPPWGTLVWGVVLAVVAVVLLMVLYMASCGGSLDDACRR